MASVQPPRIATDTPTSLFQSVTQNVRCRHLVLGYALLALTIVYFQRTRSNCFGMDTQKFVLAQPHDKLNIDFFEFPDQAFSIDTNDGPKIVIPPKFIDELKSHPALSFKLSIDNDMLVEYTKFGGPPEFVMSTIKGKLNVSLPQYVPVLHTALRRNLDKYVGEFNDWTLLKIHPVILKVSGAASARVFHSSKASESEEWLEASTGYVLSVFNAIVALKEYKPLLRPFVFPFMPHKAAINRQWQIARKLVAASLEHKKQNGGKFLDEPGTMLDHLTSGRNSNIANDLEKQVQFQMTLVAVGTLTTFASTIQALYDLAAYPQYAQELREEVMHVSRNCDGVFTSQSLKEMQKLDSFAKESQRLSSPDLTTFQRAATADITLSDGTFIPKGTKIDCATCSIHSDNRFYDNARDFDGLRFYRKRQKPGQENKHQFISVGKDDLSFGYGRHACPGRYLGHINIMLALAEVLLRYDIKNHDGQGRPKNIEIEAMAAPDPDHEILIRSRGDGFS
ncbi:hypothetical protein G7054_g13136 [Neopestalotiopsis clavispora]|nr:hypothetical protein G7054_g13136 [Neopestalotiopsis clavispora]